MMNRIQRPCRQLAALPRRAGILLAFAAASPPAWRPDPPLPPSWKLPPGWNKYLGLPPGWDGHPPVPTGRFAGPVYQMPARTPAHTVVAGGMPGWQIIVIAAGAALLAAALAVTVVRMRAARRRPTASAA